MQLCSLVAALYDELYEELYIIDTCLARPDIITNT